MGEWKTVGLSEITDVISRHYGAETFLVGVDRDHMIYYIVPSRLGLDESVEVLQDGVDGAAVRDAVGSAGFPREVFIWIEEGEAAGPEGDEMEGLLDEEDIKEIEEGAAEGVSAGGDEGETAPEVSSLERENEELKKEVERLREELARKEEPSSDEDMEFLVAELEKLREENKRLEGELAEAGKKAEQPPSGTAAVPLDLIRLYEELGGDTAELPEDEEEKAAAVAGFVEKTVSALQEDIQHLEETAARVEAGEAPSAVPGGLVELYEELGGDRNDLPAEEKERIGTLCSFVKKAVFSLREEMERLEKEKGAPQVDSDELREVLESELVTAEEAPRIAQTTRKEFDKLVQQGEITPFKEGMFKKSDLLGFALSLYEEATVPRRKYELDLEAAREELPQGHGEGECMPVEEARREVEPYKGFFGDELYDEETAEDVCARLRKAGLADESFGTASLTAVEDEDGGGKKYRIPAALVRFAERYEEVGALLEKEEELQEQIEKQAEQAEELDRKITSYKEEEEEISARLSREKEELEKLDAVLEELEHSGLVKLRDKINDILKLKEE